MEMKKIFVFFLSWFLCATLSAQISKKTLDSLEQSLTYQQALSSFRSNNVERAKTHIVLSHEYKLRGDTMKCRTHAMEALKLAHNAGSIEGEAYIALARYYQITDRLYETHVNLRNAEELFIKLKDKENLFKVYINLLHLYDGIDDKENTKLYASKVMEMAADMSTGDELNEKEKNEILSYGIYAELLFSLATFEDEGQEKLDHFIELFNKALPLNTNLTYVISTNCGDLYVKQKQPREALKYLHRTRKHFEAGKMMVMSETYSLLAEAYAMLNRIDSADYYIKKALKTPLEMDESRLILLRSRSVLEASRGNHKKSLDIFKQYHHLSDSLSKVRRLDEVGRIRMWTELNQKDIENDNLQKSRRNLRIFIWSLSGLLAIILVLLGLTISFYRKTVEKNKELKHLHTVKDKLFSVVAHDLRGPMGALVSMLKMANMLNAEMQAQLLKDITNRVDDTYSLLDNLLRWSKSQMQGMVPAPVYFNAQEGSRTVTDALQGIAINKKISLENHIGSYRIFADQDMFAVLVRNLTTNAIKYTSAEGKVILESEMSDNMLVVSVKDTGTGMPQEVQDKLFKLSETKSKRGTNNESGTGLGLVLCADFVKAIGGKIWFTSEQGKGSTFYFSVPVKEKK